MLAQPLLSSFIETSLPAQVLPSGLLPLNNNRSLVESSTFTTTTIVDRDGRTPVAFGLMSKISSKQAYCMVGKVADKLSRHSVAVERIEEDDSKKNVIFKVVDSEEGSVDKSLLRPYNAVFGEDEKKYLQQTLADSLFEQTLGTFNMDMEKNITIDVVGSERDNLDIWRDCSGFVVTDSNRFAQITVSKNRVLEVFSSEANRPSTISTISKENVADVIEFDESITVYPRSAYLNQLLANHEVTGYVASEGAVTGYALATKDRILAVYSETNETAAKLITVIASNSTSDNLTFFVNVGVNGTLDALKESANSVQQVSRLHTRTKSVNVKWAMVPIPNIGLSLF